MHAPVAAELLLNYVYIIYNEIIDSRMLGHLLQH